MGGHQTPRSLERINRAKPGSREAKAAARAVKRHAASANNNTSASGANQDPRCRNLNNGGTACSNQQPCDAHWQEWYGAA
ncbi:hypothetical protein GLAREA_12422 [Glarea lozoyensis ATCC 20868]|uniref:Uncharacterized protein n=2 Tax=Glarea lozoyensis TaxID=101852 RepID=S3DHZ9_GLAL2|nr:uncharacterized protein GLAREA_12422 [Glarea lozoyensis ATCC 20868]EHL02487.1 hypothetical protein M7I_1568 [Glarea lozoyensis 74030]EPE31666.1 hypothetical protein GLAREA_12422 [Glarea lozoyensis ATCC 20868]